MKQHNIDRLVAAMRPGVRAASVIGGVVKVYPQKLPPADVKLAQQFAGRVPFEVAR